jgi:hypothetical protein
MVGSNARNRRRSERVVLKIPVVVRIQTSVGKRTEERAHTMVVNAHGGLLRLGIELTPGQTINLINPKTHVEESSCVVRVENLPTGGFAVAFEFRRPSPQFWPIVFPPADWESVEV